MLSEQQQGVLFGGTRDESHCQTLRAGPVSLSFIDGELRYLRVGDHEVIRRIYFAVRDTAWDTAMPVFSQVKFSPDHDSFRIDQEAECHNSTVHYRWKGRIEGSNDGTIVFSADGEALDDFESPRIGICVLYGAEALAGRQFQIVNQDDRLCAAAFPHLISPTLIAEQFSALRYRTACGIQLSATLAEGLFDMEDQRNFGDSSFKAFCGHPYTSAPLRKGDRGSQRLAVRVKVGKPGVSAPASGPIRITAANAHRATVPRLSGPQASAPDQKIFATVNRARERFIGQPKVTFQFSPAVHLFDDQTLMENTSAVIDQIQTLRSFAGAVTVRVDPVLIDSHHPRPGRDMRNRGLVAAAWCARMVKHLAMAGADEAVLDVDGPYARLVLDMLHQQQGQCLEATSAAVHGPVDAFVLGQQVLWLINKTHQMRDVKLALPGRPGQVAMKRLRPKAPARWEQGAAQRLAAGTITVGLEPFEVVTVAL